MSHDPLGWIQQELAALEAADLLRRRQTCSGPQGAILEIEGRRLLNFGSNDYLGLAGDPRLAKAAAEAAVAEGWGSGASPLVVGHGRLHAQLETKLAEFEGCQAALLFASGFAANLGTIPALVGPGDAVFSDQLNHASIVDGCRLSGAKVHVYRHADVEDLEGMLRAAGGARRKLIVTDGLFSMDGGLAPLGALANLTDRYGAMLMVDEAHATGVFGRQGRGAAEHLEVDQRVHVRLGTLSKGLGSVGGFVAGSRALIEWLVNRARPYVFSTAPPQAIAAAALAALDIVRDEPWRRTALLERAAELRQTLAAQGWNVGRSGSQIIPIIVGPAARAVELSAAFRERGLLVPAIRPPSVPAGEARLRLSLSYGHTPEMIAALSEAFASAR